MSDSHGNTPAAWTGVGVGLLGFVIGGIALMLSPVSMPMFWVGVVLGVVAFPLFLVLAKLGMHDSPSREH